MMRSHRIEFVTAVNGGGTLQEHPIRPRDGDRPSTWISPFQLHYFSGLPNAVLWTFLQHAYGAASLKPTTFRLTRLPRFGQAFNAMQLDLKDRLPVEALGGQNLFSKGYKTAAAKEYPDALCAAMLRSAVLSLRKRVDSEGFRYRDMALIGPGEATWLQCLEDAATHCHATTFLADYQPSSRGPL